jgi:Domain of unknown function (DUF5050)
MPLIHYPRSSFLVAMAILWFAILGCRSASQNLPSWTKTKVLSDTEDHPSKIISDGRHVFYVTGGTVASQHEGTNNIKRIDLNDGSVTILVKGGEKIPSAALAVDDKFVYWSDGGNILRVPKEGGTSETIIPDAPNPDEMLIDNDNVYWLIWGGEGSPPLPVMYAPKKGGDVKKLTPAYLGTSGLAIDKDFVYWMTGDGIKKIAKTGGEVSEIYRNTLKTPSLGLLQDDNNFYFMQMNSSGHSSLMKCVKKTGEVSQLAPEINHTMQFADDEKNIYYFTDVQHQGSFPPSALIKISKTGGGPVTLDQGQAGWLNYLAVDGKQVYFTDISKVYAIAK